MEAHREVLQDKMKNHHLNLGTLKCKFALEECRRWCCAEGLLRKEHRYLVTSLFQTLPTIAELGESSGETPKESLPSPLAGTNSSDDENELFITQGPRTQLQLSGTAAASPCPTSQKKRKHKGRKGNQNKKLSQPSIASYFPSQKKFHFLIMYQNSNKAKSLREPISSDFLSQKSSVRTSIKTNTCVNVRE